METYNSDQNRKDQAEHNDLVSWIKGTLEHLNTDFPLSGGEQEEDLTGPGENKEQHSGFLEHLNTNFPLSGGTDE